ncbi:DUF1489 family protein [Afifella sp. IM 167]|uniref:DUF1489 family protein n=1 Tax=Afifella sp. IM 167 TaxID=2033586 RepID=UPI001CCE9120|nr:DUF1489 family protein [Afifella sp. IM 167]MBZ8132354.1 lysophospholipase [Afifella sp. IM 167]
MALHLLKLCVGADSIEDLSVWIEQRLADRRAAGEPEEHWHVTRMVPRRAEELENGGSLYWVIRGQVQVRQRLLDIRTFRGEDGITRCKLVLDPKLVPTAWQPRRAFQGWRYLKPEDAPADLGSETEGFAELPPALRGELAELGLL